MEGKAGKDRQYMIPRNVLADRYASRAMVDIWGPENKVVLERQLWLATLEAQMRLKPELGVTEEALTAYRGVINSVDLESIAKREWRTRHDVKARIEEFNALAGGLELVHQGFTSRDLTDNVELLQMRRALTLLRGKALAMLARLSTKATDWKMLVVCGRSHNVPGQPTTLGKRMATVANELLLAVGALDHFIEHFPLRGIKGAMGTQQDMADLLGDMQAVQLEGFIAEHLGFKNVLSSVGQIYPRSLDFASIAVMVQLAAAPSNFATLIRLMAGNRQVEEGFTKEQSGSSAMPHKRNARSCERIRALTNVLLGHLTMTTQLVGNQWYEGDVSCSATRRVALEDACYALDGIFETAITILDEMQIFPKTIAAEVATYAPFLSTTKFLMAAVKRGVGREKAHETIKKHALAAIDEMDAGAMSLTERLASDPDFPLGLEEVEELVDLNTGLSTSHVETVVAKVEALLSGQPGARIYKPDKIR